MTRRKGLGIFCPWLQLQGAVASPRNFSHVLHCGRSPAVGFAQIICPVAPSSELLGQGEGCMSLYLKKRSVLFHIWREDHGQSQVFNKCS